MEEAIVIIVRLVAPLLILRSPLVGVFVCMGIDYADFNFIGDNSWYQVVDKTLDLYYLGFCAFMALRWQDTLAKVIAVGAYIWWLLGVVLLIATGSQNVLVFFPNFFEVFFIFYSLFVNFAKTSQLPKQKGMLALIIASLLVPKIFQEYALHVYVPSSSSIPLWLLPLFQLPVVLQFFCGIAAPIAVLVVSIAIGRNAEKN